MEEVWRLGHFEISWQPMWCYQRSMYCVLEWTWEIFFKFGAGRDVGVSEVSNLDNVCHIYSRAL